MRIERAIARFWAAVCSAWLLVLPAAALERATLQKLFADPYSVGERDDEMPIWPIFKTTPRGEALIAYVFDYADFAPVPVVGDRGVSRLVAVRPSGAFLETKVVRREAPAFFNWLQSEAEFDFIRRDRAGELTPPPDAGAITTPLGAISDSRDYVRARLGLGRNDEPRVVPASPAHVISRVFMIGLIAAVAFAARRAAPILAYARGRIRRLGAGRLSPEPESPE